jgi:hypothetical protein
MKEVLSDVEQKRFSEFSKKVKTSLEDKLRNNPVIKSKSEELQKLSNMKDTFASIDNTKPAETDYTETDTDTED